MATDDQPPGQDRPRRIRPHHWLLGLVLLILLILWALPTHAPGG